MSEKNEAVPRIEPIRGLRVNAIRPFGYEQPVPEQKKGKKRRSDEKKPTQGGIITHEKVDYKI